MRRLWANIILAITSIVMIFVTFNAVAIHLTPSAEYASGKTLTFQLTEKTVAKEGESILPLDDQHLDANKDVAEIMKDRLEAAEIDHYKIDLFGNDIVKVTISQGDTDYTRISQYLSFNGALTLNSYANDTDYYVDESVFKDSDSPAYITDTQTIYPTINIPVEKNNDDYKSVVEGAWNSEKVIDQAADEENGVEEVSSKKMYLCYGFIPGVDSFKDSSFQSKVLLEFRIDEDANNVDHIQYFEEKDGSFSLTTVLNVAGEDGSFDKANVKTAWQNAKFYVNLLNAGTYDYDVTFIKEDTVSPWVEPLFSLNKSQTIYSSASFRAFLCAIVIVSLLLVVFYKFSALNIATTSLASVFGGVGMLAVFSAEFNMTGLIGLILLGLVSVVSGIIYATKLKEEAYHGRSLKKCNIEAYKKSVLPITDLHVVMLLIGVACFLLGGTIMKSFALVTIVGGLISLILNLTFFRGLMWLATNATYTQGKYSMFGIDQNKVPNLANEEKQTFYGPYADKNFTKHKKAFSIATIIAFVLCVGSSIAWGVVKGSVYNKSETSLESEVYFRVNESNTSNLTSVSKTISDVLDNAYISSDKNADSKLRNFVSDPELNEQTVVQYDNLEGKYENVTYAYFTIIFNEELAKDTLVYYENEEPIDLEGFFSSSNGAAFTDIEFVNYVSGERITSEQPKFTSVIIATSVAVAVASLYLMARYKLSRGLSALVMSLLTSGITAGFFSLLYFAKVGNYVCAAIPFVAALSLIFNILLANKDREMFLDDRSHDNSAEHRGELMDKAISYSFADTLNVLIVALYLGINFFGFGPDAIAWTSLLMIVGSAIACLLATTLFGPLSSWFFKQFSKVHIDKPKKVKKNKQVKQNKSAEPEEAIFIGIND